MRTRILAGITLWLAAVISIASIAWLAIDAAGRQVTASPVAASLPNHKPVKGSRPTQVPSSSDPDPSQSADPATGAGTYSTAGGRVRVNCHHDDITLDGGYAQPASGWSVLVRSAGPAQVQVVFELTDRQALLVAATCADGHPQFDQDRIEGN